MICLTSRRSRTPFDRRHYRLLNFHGAEHIQYPCRLFHRSADHCQESLSVTRHDNCVTYPMGVDLQKSTRWQKQGLTSLLHNYWHSVVVVLVLGKVKRHSDITLGVHDVPPLSPNKDCPTTRGSQDYMLRHIL
jgi:hypothetical protein